MVLAQKEAYKSMNRIERSEINLHVQLIYGKECKNIQWEKDNLFNAQGWENWIGMYKKIKMRPHFHSTGKSKIQNGLMT